MGLDARGHSGGLGILWDPTRVSLGGFQGTQYSLLVEFCDVPIPNNTDKLNFLLQEPLFSFETHVIDVNTHPTSELRSQKLKASKK